MASHLPDVEVVHSRTRYTMWIVSHNFRRPRLASFSSLLFISLIHLTNARRNITIDSNNTLLSYVPSSNWTWIAGSLDAGGGHMLTEDPNAYALINFTCKLFSGAFVRR